MLRDEIDAALKTSMKARDDKLKVSTLRLITAAIKDRDIAARGNDRCSGVGDDEIRALMAKMIKQREDSATAYEAGGRPELAEQERAEIIVIRAFMPKQLSDAEVETAVGEAVRSLNASGLKDMGRVMAALKERHSGAMDFGRAGALVKKALGA